MCNQRWVSGIRSPDLGRGGKTVQHGQRVLCSCEADSYWEAVVDNQHGSFVHNESINDCSVNAGPSNYPSQSFFWEFTAKANMVAHLDGVAQWMTPLWYIIQYVGNHLRTDIHTRRLPSAADINETCEPILCSWPPLKNSAPWRTGGGSTPQGCGGPPPQAPADGRAA